MTNTLSLLALTTMGAAWLISNHYPPWMSFYNEAAMGTGIGLISAVAAANRSVFAVPAVVGMVSIVSLVPWLQVGVGQIAFSGDAWVSSVYLLGLALAVSTGFALSKLQTERFGQFLSVSVLVAGLVSAAIAFTQVLQVDGLGIWGGNMLPGMRAEANLAQPNNLATLLGMSALALLLLREQGRVGRAVSALLLAVLITAAALTQSRTALLFGPVICAALWWQLRTGRPFQTQLSTLAVATGVHWAATWAWPSLQSLLLLTAPVSLAERGSGSLRFQVWPMLVDALGESPWVGYGWLQVGAAQLTVADRHGPIGEMWLHGHNIFLELLIWCGYPLGLLLSGLIIFWFCRRAVQVQSREAVVGVLMVAVLGVHAMLELPHHYAYFLLPVGLWVGLVESQVGATLALSARRWHVALLLVCVGLFSMIAKDYGAIEEKFRVARFESLGVAAPLSRPPPVSPNPALSGLQAYLEFLRFEVRPGMMASDLDFMRKTVFRYPYSSAVFNLACALALNGDMAEANRLIRSLENIHGVGTLAKLKQTEGAKLLDKHDDDGLRRLISQSTGKRP